MSDELDDEDESIYEDENSQFDSDELNAASKGEQFESFLRSLYGSLNRNATIKSNNTNKTNKTDKTTGTWESIN